MEWGEACGRGGLRFVESTFWRVGLRVGFLLVELQRGGERLWGEGDGRRGVGWGFAGGVVVGVDRGLAGCVAWGQS
jgi:hypothetical protein